VRHLHELTRYYRQYLRDVLDDEGFDITTVEDFDWWTGREYEIAHREPADASR
jgi:hypothetical protein